MTRRGTAFAHRFAGAAAPATMRVPVGGTTAPCPLEGVPVVRYIAVPNLAGSGARRRVAKEANELAALRTTRPWVR